MRQTKVKTEREEKLSLGRWKSLFYTLLNWSLPSLIILHYYSTNEEFQKMIIGCTSHTKSPFMLIYHFILFGYLFRIYFLT